MSRSFTSSSRSRIRSAARRARIGSSSCAAGTPNDRHHGVADELLDRAAFGLDLLAHRREVARHHLAEVFGVEPFAELRRTGDVGEQDRDDPPLFGASRGSRASARTKDRTERLVEVLSRSGDRRSAPPQARQSTGSCSTRRSRPQSSTKSARLIEGYSSRSGRNCQDVRENVVVGSSAFTVADRGSPSRSDISPKYLPDRAELARARRRRSKPGRP